MARKRSAANRALRNLLVLSNPIRRERSLVSAEFLSMPNVDVEADLQRVPILSLAPVPASLRVATARAMQAVKARHMRVATKWRVVRD